jgi:fatty acid cis/trans isomerase CTI
MRQRLIGAALVVGALVVIALVWFSQTARREQALAPPETDAPVEKTVPVEAELPVQFASEYYRDVKPILDRRCLVCHACYDAPCQLKLDSPAGLQRGATLDKVYDSARLMPAPLTRLFIDAQTTAEWRDKAFFPVLNEGEQNAAANLQDSLLYRMLLLKQQHPLPAGDLPAAIDVTRERKEFCPRLDTFAEYAEKRPLQGMPFALPGLDEEEFGTLKRWLENGAAVAKLPPLAADLQKSLTDWERFLNNDDFKSQLMGRYLYEHLFLADLYFDTREPRQFFKLVRSRTPPGQPLDIIASRRPFDDPNVPRVYYRLQVVQSSIVAKTHLPYLLDARRMARWRELFLQADYSLDRLPSYAAEVATNPFIAFAAIPVQSRYRFMLDDAEYFLTSFVKGPVCRGQIALNVLNDQFWVVFANPDLAANVDAEFLAKESGNLRLPAEIGNQSLGFVHWQHYADLQADYLAAKEKFLHEKFGAPRAVKLDLLWNGDGANHSAALTVFRHFDSASVVEGLVGDIPKTAWVMDYPMFERIYYLLVVGFDVYGDASHQLFTRLYMDFLRMEGETNFLAFLPKAKREAERNSWYQGVGAKLRDSVYRRAVVYQHETGIVYRSKNPKREFFDLLRDYQGSALSQHYQLSRAELEAPARIALQKIAKLRGWPVSYLPELIYVRVLIRGAPDQVFTLIHNVDHSNVAVLLMEKARLRPQYDSLTLVPGIVGAYPNAFWVVKDSDLPRLATRLATLNGSAAYRKLTRDFGVARSNPKFWQHSDWLHNIYREREPIEWGVLDYSRYEK